jgi:hypothetical protein
MQATRAPAMGGVSRSGKLGERLMAGAETFEILVPHDPTRRDLSAVRRVLIQSSLAELKTLGVYDRYCAFMDPGLLAEMTSLVGPGWVPLQLVQAHYEALDHLEIDEESIRSAGSRTAANVQRALLANGVQPGDPDSKEVPWSMLGAFARMGKRVYEGSSSQYVKIGRKRLLIENIGNPLYGFRYYRLAHTGFIHAAFGKLGVKVVDVTLAPYRSEGAVMETRITWR